MSRLKRDMEKVFGGARQGIGGGRTGRMDSDRVWVAGAEGVTWMTADELRRWR